MDSCETVEPRTTLVQELLRGRVPEDGDQGGDQPGPAGLVARSDAGAIVAVEVFVEQDQVPPVRVLLTMCYDVRIADDLIARFDGVLR